MDKPRTPEQIAAMKRGPYKTPTKRKGTGTKKAATEEKLLELLYSGESLYAVCLRKDMPNIQTVYEWCDEYPEYGRKVTRAREVGYEVKAEKILEEAETAKDAALGTLAWRAGTWHLGKRSLMFSDNKERSVKLKHTTLSDEEKAWLGL
jgi:hypothetical protein